MRFFLGDGMFTTNGPKWAGNSAGRPSRPSTATICVACSETMREATDEMLARWDAYAADDREIGLTSEAMRLALDIALRTMFGVRMTGQAKIIYDALNVILPELERRVWAITPLANWLPRSKVRACNGAIEAIDRVVADIIRQWLEAEDRPDDLLSMLIAAEETQWGPHSMKRLRDQVVIFLVAGHETTATTLAWSWYTACRSPR